MKYISLRKEGESAVSEAMKHFKMTLFPKQNTPNDLHLSNLGAIPLFKILSQHTSSYWLTHPGHLWQGGSPSILASGTTPPAPHRTESINLATETLHRTLLSTNGLP